jgi:hypothetical protein
VSERRQFPRAPDKARVIGADGLLTLQWLAWVGALTDLLQRKRVYSFPIDVPSIPSGGGWWGQYSVPTAVVGDFVEATLEPSDRDISVLAHVSAAGTVTVWARNWGAGSIDLGAGTVRISVERAR